MVMQASYRFLLLFSPDEVAAVRAERGLPQEGGHELVRVDLVDLSLHGAPPLSRHEAALLKLGMKSDSMKYQCPQQTTFYISLHQPSAEGSYY